MSNRSLLEFNHDYCPADDEACLALGRALQAYMRAANTDELPQGVARKHYRHHSEPEPLPAARLGGLLAAVQRVEAEAKAARELEQLPVLIVLSSLAREMRKEFELPPLPPLAQRAS